MKYIQPKIIATDSGDMSVGCFPATWEIQVPFEIDLDRISWDDLESLLEFKEIIDGIYSQYADGRYMSSFDFVNEAFMREELAMDKHYQMIKRGER